MGKISVVVRSQRTGGRARRSWRAVATASAATLLIAYQTPPAVAGTPFFYDRSDESGLQTSDGTVDTVNPYFATDANGTNKVPFPNNGTGDMFFSSATSATTITFAMPTFVPTGGGASIAPINFADNLVINNNAQVTLTASPAGSQYNFVGTAGGTGPAITVGQSAILHFSADSTSPTFIGSGSVEIAPGVTRTAVRPDLNLAGGSEFNLLNGSTTADRTANLDQLIIGSSDNTISVDNNITNSVTNGLTLNFNGGLGTRAVGGTVDISASGGNASSNNPRIVSFSGSTQGFIAPYLFVDSNNYAARASSLANAATRALSYGTDPNTATSITSDAYVRLTATPASSQASVTLRTLDLSGNGVGLNLASGAVLTLSSGGLLKGTGSGAIGGGSGIRAATDGELVIRVGRAADTLTLNTPVLANGSNVLTKSGPGTLILNVGNQITGRTIVNGGLISIDSDLKFGPQPAAFTADQLTLSGGGIRATSSFTWGGNRGITIDDPSATIDIPNAGDTVTINVPIVKTAAAGADRFTKSGPGTLIFGGTTDNTYNTVEDGQTVVQEGTLLLNKTAGVDAIPGNLQIGSNSGASALVKLLAADQISNQKSFEIRSTGVFDFNGFNEVTGRFHGNGTMRNTGAAAVTYTINANFDDDFGGLVTDTGGGAISLTKQGTGNAILSGLSNTFRGTVRIQSGTLQFASLADAGAGSNGTGTIFLGNRSSSFVPTFSVAAVTPQTTTRPINLFGTLAAEAKLSVDGATVTFAGDFNTSNTSTNVLAKVLTLTGNSAVGSGVISGNIHETGPDTLSISKNGTTPWTLSGANTYSGTTSVSAGLLSVNGTHSGGGAYSVSGSGILGGSGSITTAGGAGVAVSGNGKLSPGNSIGTLSFDLSGGSMNLTSITSGELVFELGSSGVSDKVNVQNGTINIGTLDFSEFNFVPSAGFAPFSSYTLLQSPNPITGQIGTAAGLINGNPSTIAVDSNRVVLNVVPEPASAGLLCLMGAGWLGRRRSRRSR